MARNSLGRIAISTLALTVVAGTQAHAAETPLSALTAASFSRIEFAAATAASTSAPAAATRALDVSGDVSGEALGHVGDAVRSDVRDAAAAVDQQPLRAPQRQSFAGTRPRVLPALYASLAALNVMDAITTSRGLQGGAVEANPFMKSVVGSTPAMLTVKAGTTAFSIWLSERLWKKNRLAAIATMAVVNGTMGVVALHNQAVIHRLR